MTQPQHRMKGIALFFVAAGSLAGVVASMVPASRQAEKGAAPVFVTQIPSGYRDWTVISMAHEAGDLNSLGAKLGNDVAIKAFREGKLPFLDGTIIAAVHWTHSPSDENNKIFGRASGMLVRPHRSSAQVH